MASGPSKMPAASNVNAASHPEALLGPPAKSKATPVPQARAFVIRTRATRYLLKIGLNTPSCHEAPSLSAGLPWVPRREIICVILGPNSKSILHARTPICVGRFHAQYQDGRLRLYEAGHTYSLPRAMTRPRPFDSERGHEAPIFVSEPAIRDYELSLLMKSYLPTP
jgi:hypothetical protein